MTIFKIRFKRKESSKHEYGIYIEPTDIIIDSKGKIVEGLVYNFDRLYTDFCIDLSLILL